MNKINWEQIENEYITTDITIRALAKKHGVAYQSVAFHSKNKDWVNKRQSHKNKLVTCLEQKSIDTKVAQAEEYVDLWRQARLNALRCVVKETEELDTFRPYDQLRIVEMVEKLRPEEHEEQNAESVGVIILPEVTKGEY